MNTILKQERSCLKRLARAVAHREAQAAYSGIRDRLIREIDRLASRGAHVGEISEAIERVRLADVVITTKEVS